MKQPYYDLFDGRIHIINNIRVNVQNYNPVYTIVASVFDIYKVNI